MSWRLIAARGRRKSNGKRDKLKNPVLEALEPRQLLSISPSGPDPFESQTSLVAAPAAPTQDSTAVLVGPSQADAATITAPAFANDGASTADSTALASSPADSSTASNPASSSPSSTYVVVSLKPIGHGQGGHGGSRVTQTSGELQQSGQGGGSANPLASSGGGSAISGNPQLSLGSATAPEGCVLKVPVTVSGAKNPQEVSWTAYQNDVNGMPQIMGTLDFGGSGNGTKYIYVLSPLPKCLRVSRVK